MITLEKLSSFCDVLNKNGVKYILIGGCAVILHGLERPTYDIDFLIKDSEENVEKLKKSLLSYLKEDEIEDINLEVLKEYKVVRVGLGDYYVDLITKIADIDYEVANKDKYIEKIDNVEIPVAGLDTMIELKKGYRKIDKKDRIFLEGKKEYLKQNKRQK
ncbi:hypothetical protein BXT86_04495 [candidate division WOR-3 bacterium 4484_100]|uniref:Uncharacterized protein n=1 Tax=candidate division WOR-3 bacterium 4484_100 TaxID=1936077 RepID=A0A1V4QGG6_UNCW3|nr:MAG: hypothetical protein BXT86_04495 [candidate division WOR-3 bacterium 4484_100]